MRHFSVNHQNCNNTVWTIISAMLLQFSKLHFHKNNLSNLGPVVKLRCIDLQYPLWRPECLGQSMARQLHQGHNRPESSPWWFPCRAVRCQSFGKNFRIPDWCDRNGECHEMRRTIESPRASAEKVLYKIKNRKKGDQLWNSCAPSWRISSPESWFSWYCGQPAIWIRSPRCARCQTRRQMKGLR